MNSLQSLRNTYLITSLCSCLLLLIKPDDGRQRLRRRLGDGEKIIFNSTFSKTLLMKLLVALVFLSPFLVTAQKVDDTKIIITLNDNIDIYKKVKIALVDLDFIVKDNYNPDTLSTYPREFSSIPGQCRITAIIKGNTVTISGIYGLTKIDDFGYTRSTKDYQKIIYYKGSKGWDLLKTVAEKIGGQMTFSK